MARMKRYKVTITTYVLAEDDSRAWEYGHNLASRAPNMVAHGVDEDPDAPESEIETEEAE